LTTPEEYNRTKTALAAFFNETGINNVLEMSPIHSFTNQNVEAFEAFGQNDNNDDNAVVTIELVELGRNTN
jgi:hypothetical protein